MEQTSSPARTLGAMADLAPSPKYRVAEARRCFATRDYARAEPILLRVAEEYLAPLRHAGIDTLVLGCTHYPFLEGAISYVMGPDVSLVSSDIETAKDVYRQLVSRDLLADGLIVRSGDGIASAVATARQYVTTAEALCDELPPSPSTDALRAAPSALLATVLSATPG